VAGREDFITSARRSFAWGSSKARQLSLEVAERVSRWWGKVGWSTGGRPGFFCALGRGFYGVMILPWDVTCDPALGHLWSIAPLAGVDALAACGLPIGGRWRAGLTYACSLLIRRRFFTGT